MVNIRILDEDNLDSSHTKKPYLEFLVSPTDDVQVGNEADIITQADLASRKAIRRNAILNLIATEIGSIAPNLSAIVGSSVAAKLVAEAGGSIHVLSKIPSRIINIRVGFLEETEISQGTPQFLKKYVSGLLAKRLIWAAIADANSFSPSGELGRDLRAGILKQIDKRQRPTSKKPKPNNVLQIRSRRKQTEHGAKKGEENSDVIGLGQMLSQMSFGDSKPRNLGPKVDNKFKRSREVGASTTQALAIVANQLESGTDLSEIAAFANLRI